MNALLLDLPRDGASVDVARLGGDALLGVTAERIAAPQEPESAEPVIHSAKSIGKLANLAHSKSAVRSSNVRKNS